MTSAQLSILCVLMRLIVQCRLGRLARSCFKLPSYSAGWQDVFVGRGGSFWVDWGQQVIACSAWLLAAESHADAVSTGLTAQHCRGKQQWQGSSRSEQWHTAVALGGKACSATLKLRP